MMAGWKPIQTPTESQPSQPPHRPVLCNAWLHRPVRPRFKGVQSSSRRQDPLSNLRLVGRNGAPDVAWSCWGVYQVMTSSEVKRCDVVFTKDQPAVFMRSKDWGLSRTSWRIYNYASPETKVSQPLQGLPILEAPGWTV